MEIEMCTAVQQQQLFNNAIKKAVSWSNTVIDAFIHHKKVFPLFMIERAYVSLKS